MKVLRAIGIEPQEWPSPLADLWNGPYIQSERLDIYKKYVQKMLNNGTAYVCFCSSERLDSLRAEQEALKLPTKYDGLCRHLAKEEVEQRIQAGEKYVIRLKVPKWEKLQWDDLVRGRLEFNSSDTDDQVLMKSDGFPTYHLAVVIDDYLMQVTHVMRWEEWISSMPKQILVARALDIKLPEYAHLPLILWTDRKKLSKRTGDVAVEEYLKQGFLKEALVNYLAFVGWNPKTTEEFFSLEELVERFDIADIHKAGGVFDVEKLTWMNAHYIATLPIETVYARLDEYFAEYDTDFYKNVWRAFAKEYHLKIIRELQSRLKKLDEYKALTPFLYADPQAADWSMFASEKMNIQTREDAIFGMTFFCLAMESVKNTDDLETMKNTILSKIKESGCKNGQILWPVRVALSAEAFSPGAFELVAILWREKSIARLKKNIVNLQKIG